MGGRDSSSKTKSSKRKRDKISSKKKNRRKEPQKRRRFYDSVTSDSDNGSLNSKHTSESDHRRRINKNKKRRRDSSLSSCSDYESLSSDSDSGNANKSRKARQSQVCLKHTKRRGRKRFTSPNVRKRKRLNKDHVAKPIKKSSRKKSRKYRSGSSGSNSESCSTCQSSGTADGKHQRRKAIPGKEVERSRGRESHRVKKKREESTSRFPSCDRGSHPNVSVSSGDRSLFPTNNSRRLRSVIGVVGQPHDEGENRWEMDPHKEEIVYDQNDYPSPKSVDSNEGGGRMESGNHSHGVFSDRICIENVAGKEVPELGESRIDGADQDKAGDGQLEVAAHMNDSEKNVSVLDAASGGDLLESILRQKALENLRKFKGRIQKGPSSTTVNESDMDPLSAGTAVVVQNKSINQTSRQEMDQRSVVSSKGDFSLMKEVKKCPDSEQVDKDPGMAKQSLAYPPNGRAHLECTKEDRSVSRSHTGPGNGDSNACSSSLEPSSSVGQHSLERGNEAKDGSQFEQKTMTVMKGGEVVQVNYKVYIPKKAPALARRQLRR